MKDDLKKYIIKLIEKKLRINERGLLEYRDIKIETGISENAEGSAKVNIGETEVIIGVKMNVGTPYPDSPERGNIICTAEFNPIAHPEFEPGPPRENAIELARVVDRGVRESGAIDLKKLCITKGEKVWNIFIDIYIMNHDGNLIDAAGLGALAALLKAKIPKMDEDNNVMHGEWSKKKIPMQKKPIPTTFVKIGNNIIVDSDFKEESVIDGRLTITGSSEKDVIYSLQKGGVEGFTLDEIKFCLKESFKIRKKIAKIIEKL